MKVHKIIPSLSILALILCTTSLASEGVFPYEVKRATLDNGLKVLMIPMPSDGLSAYWSIVRTGSRDEVEKGVTGFAHFFEHMMFRGSEKFPGPVYDSIVTSMGADANAYTTDDLTAYHLSFATEDLPTVIEIEADRFKNLQYSEAEFKTEAGAVYGEYRKGRTNPFWVLFEGIQATAFDSHTYQHMTIGFEEDIMQMPQQFDYSMSFFERFYRPENVVLLIVGDFNPEGALNMIREHYGDWKTGYVAPVVPQEPVQTEQKRAVIPFDGQTLPILAVSFKGERFLPNDRTMMAATLLGDLAFGETSPLYRKLVLEEQRVEVLAPDFGLNRDPGVWSVLARVKDPVDLAPIEAEIFAAVAQLQREPPPQERLDDVRSMLKYGFLSGLTTPNAVAGDLARRIAMTGDVTCIDEMYATFDQVTPEDVQAAANQWFTKGRSTVTILHAADSPLPDTALDPSRVVLMPVAEDPNVSFKIWFSVGSQNDPAGKEGLAALTGALLSEGGTEKDSYEEILQRLFPLAGFYGVSVDKEMTVLSGSVHRDNVDAFYELFANAALRPGFREEDFRRLRDQAISSIENTLRYSSDEELGKSALNATVFAGTPYEHIVDGTVAGLKSITLQDVREFFQRHYTKDSVVFGLGGAYADSLPTRLATDLQRLSEGAAEAIPAPQPAAIEGRQVTLVEKPGPSTAISFGFPIDLHRGSREFYALWIANSWLGEHRNSAGQLFQVIREARGMNYGNYSYLEAFPQGGRRSFPPTGVGRRQQMFEVWIRPVPSQQAIFALRAGLREVDKLVTHGLTEEQFMKTKAFLSKYCLHFAETTSARLGYAVDDLYYGIEEGHLARFRKMLSEITLDEVNAAIRRHLSVDNLVIAMVTEDAEAMKQALVSDAPSPMDYGEVTKPQEVLDEDREIERYPLKVSADNVRIIPVGDMFAGKSHS